MLTWEDPATPLSKPVHNPQPYGMPGLQSAPIGEAASAVPSFSSPAAAAAAFAPQVKSAEQRRVNAADKRIINGQTDVNQLVPFKYKWAWENTWPPAPTTGCPKR